MDTKIAVPNIPSIGVCVNQHVNKTQKVDRFLQEETFTKSKEFTVINLKNDCRH